MTSLHVGEVTRTHRLSTGMVRVTLAGDGLSRFTTTGVGDEYVRVHFPDELGRLKLPEMDAEGTWHYPPDFDSHVAPYTIRRHDAATGELDIDVVVHGHGRGGEWASVATPGDRIAFGDPRGLYELPGGCTRQVFVTDATGLPALARLLEQLPADVDALAVVEVAEEGHRLELTRHSGPLSLRWIVGRGNGVGPSALTQALREIDLGSDTHVWVAGESGELRDARRYLRHERKLPEERYTVIGYWNDSRPSRGQGATA